MSRRVAVGEGLRPQGLRGALRVRPWLEDLEAYRGIGEVFLQSDPLRRLEVESCHLGGKGTVVWKFRGVDTPEEAGALRGAVFLADRALLPGEAQGVLYWEDFEGTEAVDESGALLGRFEDLFGTGGNDILVIRTPEGGELLAPALREVLLRREGTRWVVRLPRMGGAEDEEEGRDAL
ncbi:MAG: ribosome maturation factor RimM [Nitrospinota bacterium]